MSKWIQGFKVWSLEYVGHSSSNKMRRMFLKMLNAKKTEGISQNKSQVIVLFCVFKPDISLLLAHNHRISNPNVWEIPV